MPGRKTLYYIGIMLLVSSLLMVVANNVPIAASYRWVWGPVFLLFSLLYYSKTYNKQVANAFIYGIFYCGILQYTLWNYANDWYKKAIFEDFYALIVIIIFYAILSKKYYLKEWINFAKIGLVFFIITGIMTIVATEINPMVVRASYSSGKDYMQGYEFMQRLGFGSYGYMTALIALLPIIVSFIKKRKKIWLSRRNWIIILVFFYFVLIRSQIFVNILVASLVIILSIVSSKHFKKSMFFMVIIGGILLLIPAQVWVDLLTGLSGFFNPDSEIYFKLSDIASFIKSPDVLLDPSTGAAVRAERYPMLFDAFIAQPLFGDASYSSNYNTEMGCGGHLYWMSRLALWGILGFMGYLFILKNIFKPVIKIFNEEFKYYYYLSLLSIVIMGFIKNLGGRDIYIMLLIIIPGLYYLQITENIKVKKKPKQ